MGSRAWTHGCDACGADDPVEYVLVIGYLCAFCRRPESIKDLWRELRASVPLPGETGGGDGE